MKDKILDTTECSANSSVAFNVKVSGEGAVGPVVETVVTKQIVVFGNFDSFLSPLVVGVP